MELYIHIPFCRKKCSYCSFTSFTDKEAFFETYIDLILTEASLRIDEAEELFTTVYIGGGTPSLLPPRLFRKLLSGLKEIYDFHDVAEYSSEANPGTVTEEWLETAASQGINRLSFGMQAHQQKLLTILGRIHHTDEVEHSVMLARRAGISNINLDLIFGIPTQSITDWIETLETALSFSPCHISAYGLIPEEGTPLFRKLQNKQMQLPDTDTERDMYETAVRILRKHGLQRYEISNFAACGYECLHNIGYWSQIPYIGLGVSAASMTGCHIRPDGMTYHRRTNPNNLAAYMKMIEQKAAPSCDLISPKEARFETLMLGLRLTQGISEDSFFKRHSVSLEQCYGRKLHTLAEAGLMLHEGNTWRLTDRGFDIQNSILVELMDEPV